MQVSDVQDHITHAVISRHDAIECTISENADFFHMLSATLYSNQKLAVIREVLCNANDAHIAAGCTETPIKVSFEEGQMTIQDFGKGIPHDKMGEIYGRYGESTKLNDGNQTGGFGLGSKAPWAYTEQFTVVSTHAGTRTIYNLSKSSAEVSGKPGIIPLINFPSQESGLIVKIPIKADDKHKFISYIHNVVKYGEMNVVLNGGILTTLEFSKAGSPFYLCNDDFFDKYGVFVRYGNVVYPVDLTHEAIVTVRAKVSDLLRNKLGLRSLVLLAEPNTITVTPSRESLSMQTKTIATVKGLLEKFVEEFQTGDRYKQFNLAKLQQFFSDQQATKSKSNTVFFDSEQHFTAFQQRNFAHKTSYTTFEDVAGLLLTRSYPKYGEFRKKHLQLHIEEYKKEVLENKGLITSFSKVFDQSYGRVGEFDGHRWFLDHVVGPIARRIRSSKTMSMDNLVCMNHPHQITAQKYSCRETTRQIAHSRWDKAHPMSVSAFMPYLRNIVVLAFNRQDPVDRTIPFDRVKERFGFAGQGMPFLAYIVPRSKERVEEARKALKSLGVMLIDMTEVHQGEHPKAAAPLIVNAPPPLKADKRPRSMIVKMSAALTRGGSFTSAPLAEKTAQTIDKPEWVYQVSLAAARDGFNRLGGFSEKTSSAIIKLFGDKGGYVSTELQEAKLIAAGAKEVTEYIAPLVADYVKNSKEIAEFLASNMGHCTGVPTNMRRTILSSSFSIYLNCAKFMKSQGLNIVLSEEPKNFLHIFNDISWIPTKYEDSIYAPIRKDLKAIKPKKELITLRDQFMKSVSLEYLDPGDMCKSIESNDSVTSKAALDLLQYALTH